MILTIDIGNTTTVFGVFEKTKLESQFSIGTQPNRKVSAEIRVSS